MAAWKYIKGSDKDFEGAPEWATICCMGSNIRVYYENVDYSGRWKNASGDGTGVNGLGGFPIIAQRERVTSINDDRLAQDVVAINPKYNRPCKGVTIDVYDVLQAFNVTNPALQHLVKKALAVGQRGHKDKMEDLRDILASAQRAIELEEVDK